MCKFDGFIVPHLYPKIKSPTAILVYFSKISPNFRKNGENQPFLSYAQRKNVSCETLYRIFSEKMVFHVKH